MKPIGEIAPGPHGWHLVGGGFGRMVFGPLPVAGVKPERKREAPPEVFVESSKNLVAEPDAATAAASALLSKARKHDEQRERRLYDPWRERR